MTALVITQVMKYSKIVPGSAVFGDAFVSIANPRFLPYLCDVIHDFVETCNFPLGRRFGLFLLPER